MAKVSASVITIYYCVLTIVLWDLIITEAATTAKPRTKKTIIRRRKPTGVTPSLSLGAVNAIPSTDIPKLDIVNAIPITDTSELYDSDLIPSTSSSPVSYARDSVRVSVDSAGHGLHVSELNVNLPNGSTIVACDNQCNPNNCIWPQNCLTETVLDNCSCCYVCAAIEGDRCYNESLKLPYSAGMGICGSSLHCILRNDLESDEQAEALCQCRGKRIICGSDNVTYSSECKLREASRLTPSLSIQSWHPCLTAPWMTEIDNVTAATGEEISLSCEVRAYPSPTIHWEFLAESPSTIYTLPGDDSSIVVTIRGGPEQMMTSSWIQIISVSPGRQGTYFCIASNSEGSARKQTYVSIYNKSNAQ